MNYQNPDTNSDQEKNILHTFEQITKVIENIEKVIQGKRTVIENVLAALIANGHVILLDVPGVGKTLLAKALAKSIDTHFKRIQFTPDLLPSDITGVNIFNPKTREFEFQPGPVFTSILLADEINRSSPKTQSALLEAMEERQVTIDNVQYKLPEMFFVIATQNPIEHAGTYPLPAAQLDRFLMRLSIGYPDAATEKLILNIHTRDAKPLDELKSVISASDVIKWQHLANAIYFAPVLDDYLVSLAQATRNNNPNGHGVSPRATLLLKRVSRAIAILNKRNYVIPDDIRRVIQAVFAHRLVTGGKVGEAIVEEILSKVNVP
ncbi:MAG: MoxR family ATPase [bacterium]